MLGNRGFSLYKILPRKYRGWGQCGGNVHESTVDVSRKVNRIVCRSVQRYELPTPPQSIFEGGAPPICIQIRGDRETVRLLWYHDKVGAVIMAQRQREILLTVVAASMEPARPKTTIKVEGSGLT